MTIPPPPADPGQPPLTRPGVGPIALSLALGAAGGAVFALLQVPLAWMLGPMIVNIAASVRGWPVLIPHAGRVAVLCVVGVFLGGSFSPELLARAGDWALSLSLMLVFVPLITLVASQYFRRVAGFDRATAVFSGAPGTLTAMVIVGGEAGADERLIALTQGLRVVFVVILMPLVVTALIAAAPHDGAILPPGGPFSWTEGALLVAAASVGWLIARLFSLPAAAMTGAMLASAALYLSGLVDYRPPDALMWVALWVLGSAIGSRFSTVTAATFFSVSRHAVAATAIVIGVSAAFAGFAAWLTDTPYLTALVSFTPGGVAEMCLIAIAFDIDPAYVAVHHLARILILITAVPFVARALFPKPRH
ncbi:MAG: AbrB family transcriptional regulator [Rhodospirillaceae bacterium]|nr:AbrB family transcriptional regulator [Rhodospirillaceae bacterium]